MTVVVGEDVDLAFLVDNNDDGGGCWWELQIPFWGGRWRWWWCKTMWMMKGERTKRSWKREEVFGLIYGELEWVLLLMMWKWRKMHCCEIWDADVTTEFEIERVRTIGVVVDWCGGAQQWWWKGQLRCGGTWEKKGSVFCVDTLKRDCVFCEGSVNWQNYPPNTINKKY